jgi:aspartate 1-decarboxylase
MMILKITLYFDFKNIFITYKKNFNVKRRTESVFYCIQIKNIMRWMLRGKIHRATVTETRLDYEGSITVDQDLLDKSGIWLGEKVYIANVTNGSRFETYSLPGERGSGIIALNGAAAHLCNVGDKIIIMGFELTDEQIRAKVVLVNEYNEPIKEFTY